MLLWPRSHEVVLEKYIHGYFCRRGRHPSRPDGAVVRRHLERRHRAGRQNQSQAGRSPRESGPAPPQEVGHQRKVPGGDQRHQHLQQNVTSQIHDFSSIYNQFRNEPLKNIFLLLNRVRGSDISERHELAYTDNPPWIEFPKGFCLKPLEDNGTVCEEPMGISVVLYEANPLVNNNQNSRNSSLQSVFFLYPFSRLTRRVSCSTQRPKSSTPP